MFDYSDLPMEWRSEVNLGLPNVREQRHREKVEKLWRWTWRICIWTILFASFAMAGYHASPKQVYPQIVKCRHV